MNQVAILDLGMCVCVEGGGGGGFHLCQVSCSCIVVNYVLDVAKHYLSRHEYILLFQLLHSGYPAERGREEERGGEIEGEEIQKREREGGIQKTKRERRESGAR